MKPLPQVPCRSAVPARRQSNVRLTEKSTLYGLAGRSFTDLNVSGLGINKSPNGLLLGAGLEHQIGNTPFAFRLEGDWNHFNAETISSTKVKPDFGTGLVSVVWKFGGPNLASPASAPLK